MSLSFTHVSVSGGSLCTRKGVWYYDEALHTVLLGADDSLLHHEVGGGLALLVLALARKHAHWHDVLPAACQEAVGVAAEQTDLGSLVAVDLLLHHKVGGGVLFPARGEGVPCWS